MKLKEIISIVQATEIITNEHNLEQEYSHMFACDLMSDVLALVRDNPEQVMLITGLANNQVIHTAEMLDIQSILFVRGKSLGESDIAMAREKHLTIYTTQKSMFETCGLLYQQGVFGIPLL